MEDMSLLVSVICVLISAVSMGAAICSARYSSKSAKASKKSATVAENTYKKTIEPNVIAYIAPSPKEPCACHLVIENIGKDPARDIRIYPACNFPVNEEARQYFNNSFVYNGIPFLEPNGVRRTFIGFFDELMRKEKDTDVRVVYNEKEESFPISFSSFAWVVKDKEIKDLQLERIADALEKLQEDKQS